jgi:hypothetical protein
MVLFFLLFEWHAKFELNKKYIFSHCSPISLLHSHRSAAAAPVHVPLAAPFVAVAAGAATATAAPVLPAAAPVAQHQGLPYARRPFEERLV